MKIIYCITKADNGGAQTHLIQLANHFCVHHDVYVIVGNHGPMIEQLDARVNVLILEHLVGPIDFKQDILAVKVLAQLFSKFNLMLSIYILPKLERSDELRSSFRNRKTHV